MTVYSKLASIIIYC